MANHKASYWKYTGNHFNGTDCPRYNGHGYPMLLVSYLAFHGGEGVSVCHKKGDQLGHEVVVSAPPSTWEKAWIALAKDVGSQTEFDRIADQNGKKYGIIDGVERLTELHQKKGTDLEMIKSGFVPINNELWIEDSSIA